MFGIGNYGAASEFQEARQDFREARRRPARRTSTSQMRLRISERPTAWAYSGPYRRKFSPESRRTA